VQSGRRIGVLATLETTLAPTVRLVRETAARSGVPVEVVSRLCEGAFDAVLAGDAATHDRLVGDGLAELARSVDVIVLAQASMARIVADLPPADRRIPILSSPELAIQRASEVIESGAGEGGSGPGSQRGHGPVAPLC
jgi:hypothetical protein